MIFYSLFRFLQRITILNEKVLVAWVILFSSVFFSVLSSYAKAKIFIKYKPRDLPPVTWDGVCPKKDAICPESFEGTPPLLLVSLDGFRPDFMERGITPTIKNITQCGVHAPFMYSVFPTKTFSNHYSQVTGLYPASHGIVDNTMYDPQFRKIFKKGTPEMLNPRWWLKEPIWVTAQKQGKKSGIFFWPGSEVKINGTYPTHWRKYNMKIDYAVRVDQILSWLDLPKESRPNLLTLYVNQPDYNLHLFGLNAKETNDSLKKVDRMIERLLSGLQMRSLLDCVNIIIMSDHGMSEKSCNRVFNVNKYINASEAFIIGRPFGRIRPKEETNTTLINEMVSKLKCRSPHVRTYYKEQLPLRLHYAESPRIEPIFLDLDAGYTLVREDVKWGDSICTGGDHGYDNLFPDMKAIFLAYGPAFKKNYVAKPFLSIELYELMAELLNIKPNPNNGTRGSLHHILMSPKYLGPTKEPSPPAVSDVPSEESEYNSRVSASNCECFKSQKQSLLGNIEEVRSLHLPFGVPYSPGDNATLLLLYNQDYVNSFHLELGIPLWSSFTIRNQGSPDAQEEVCWTGDGRIPSANAPKCYSDLSGEVIQQPLFPTAFSNPSSKEEVGYITNAIPKSQNFTNLLENAVNRILSGWVLEYGEVNVVQGPAFNLMNTEVKPPFEILQKYKSQNPQMVPTHIFIIATWCSFGKSLKSCDPSNLETYAMLLPNKPFPFICAYASDIIQKNAARVGDVEMLTGISFFTGIPVYDAIRLRTLMPDKIL